MTDASFDSGSFRHRHAREVEFVGKDDPQTQPLLSNTDDQYGEYTRETFERLLSSRVTVLRTEPLQEGRRVLYHAARRQDS